MVTKPRRSKLKFKFERPVNRLTSVNQIDFLVGKKCQTPMETQKQTYYPVINGIQTEIDFYRGMPTLLRTKTQEDLDEAYKHIINLELPVAAGSDGYIVKSFNINLKK